MKLALALPPKADPHHTLPGLWAAWRATGLEADTLEIWLPGGVWPPAPPLHPGLAPDRVYVAPVTAEEYWAGPAAAQLAALLAERRFDLLLLPDSPSGRELALATAAQAGGGGGTGPVCRTGSVLRPSSPEGIVTTRRVCAAHLEWTETHRSFPLILAVALGDAAQVSAAGAAPATRPPITQLYLLPPLARPAWVAQSMLAPDPAQHALADAEHLLVCGLGAGSKAVCDKARLLASRLGMAFGLTRPAALGGWGAPGEIIGQSGVVSAPKTCLLLGVSGAPAFMAGVQNAAHLAAVNTDPDAPVFREADLGLVAEVERVVDLMLEEGGSALGQ